MEISFTVGSTETHRVAFAYDRFRNVVTIDVDGVNVRRDVFRFQIPTERKYDTIVGDDEQHSVELRFATALFWSKFRKPQLTANVDGHPIRATNSSS